MKELDLLSHMNEIELYEFVEASKRDSQRLISLIDINKQLQLLAEHRLICLQIAAAERE
jgi:hypothetical protein